MLFPHGCGSQSVQYLRLLVGSRHNRFGGLGWAAMGGFEGEWYRIRAAPLDHSKFVKELSSTSFCGRWCDCDCTAAMTAVEEASLTIV